MFAYNNTSIILFLQDVSPPDYGAVLHHLGLAASYYYSDNRRAARYSTAHIYFIQTGRQDVGGIQASVSHSYMQSWARDNKTLFLSQFFIYLFWNYDYNRCGNSIYTLRP